MKATKCPACGFESATGKCAVCGGIVLTRQQVNEHYGRINERFDVRHKQITELGFKRESIKEYNIAVYVRRQPGCKPEVIQAATLTCADEVVWAEVLADHAISN